MFARYYEIRKFIQMGDKNKKFWQQPWGYGESFLIALSLVIIGFEFNFIIGKGVSSLTLPTNIYVGVFVVVLLLAIHFLFKKNRFYEWLTGTPATISAITLYTFLVLLMGFIPQGSSSASGFIQKIGLTDIVSSYAFLLAQMYFLLTLGLVSLKRSFPLKGKNIGFFLNHFGLWLTIFAAIIGAGDIQRISLTTNKTGAVYSGVNQNNEVVSDLGLAIQLEEFLMEEYSPKGYIVDNKSGEVLSKELFYLEKGNKSKLLDWEIEVTEFYKTSVSMGDKFHPISDIGAAPSAYIVAKNTKTNQKAEGWISCGSFRFPGDFLALNDSLLLVMEEPAAKRFSSKIKIYTEQGKLIETTVDVNKPVTVNGWKIYQLSYNSEMGRWSDTSTLELVKDPWIPLVYTGIIMLILGALYMFWIGNKQSQKKIKY